MLDKGSVLSSNADPWKLLNVEGPLLETSWTTIFRKLEWMTRISLSVERILTANDHDAICRPNIISELLNIYT